MLGLERAPFLGQVRLVPLGQGIIPQIVEAAAPAATAYDESQIVTPPAPPICPVGPSGTAVCPPPMPAPAEASNEEKKAIEELTATLKTIKEQQAKGQQVPPEFWEMVKQQQALVAQMATQQAPKESFPWTTVGIVVGGLGAAALVYALASSKH